MHLRYQTAIATMIQFVAMVLLNIGNTTVSVVSTCTKNGNDCISNLIVSLIFFILISCWFACVMILGYYAQERRSRQLAWVLVGVEAAIAMVALFNAQHHTDPLSLATSIIDLVLALWVIWLAFRIIRSKGGRVVARQRHHKITADQ